MQISNNWQLGELDNYSGVVWFRRWFVFLIASRRVSHAFAAASGIKR
jgi:hypothetical protein